MSELTIREARLDDVPGIVSLMRRGLGEGTAPRTAEFWTWKHDANPFGSSPCLVADADGTLAGLRAFMRWDWVSAGGKTSAVRAVDTVTHPDFRRRGIFSRLTLALLQQAGDEGIHFVYNTPNEYSRPGYLKMGWQVVGRVPVLVRPGRPLRLLARFLGVGPTVVEPPALTTFPRFADVPTATLSDVARSLDGRTASRYQTPRSADYLIWRYREIPGLTYHALWSDSKPALIVFRGRTRRGLQELAVVEALGDTAAAGELLRQLIRFADADYLVACAAKGTSERRSLRLAGFLPLPRIGPVLTVRPLNEHRDLPDPLRIGSWRFSLGDLELF